jgi:hypothetical protein
MSTEIAETTTEIADAIKYAASEVAYEVFGAFVGASEYRYTAGAFAGDVEALTAALGRAPTDAELEALPGAVDEALEARISDMAEQHAG